MHAEFLTYYYNGMQDLMLPELSFEEFKRAFYAAGVCWGFQAISRGLMNHVDMRGKVEEFFVDAISGYFKKLL